MTRDSKLLESAWEDFRAHVIHPKASELQLTEMRRAFYAGAGCLLVTLLSTVSPGDDVQQSDLDRLKSVNDELVAFTDAARRGEV
jgi:hypothetical protein